MLLIIFIANNLNTNWNYFMLKRLAGGALDHLIKMGAAFAIRLWNLLPNLKGFWQPNLTRFNYFKIYYQIFQLLGQASPFSSLLCFQDALRYSIFNKVFVVWRNIFMINFIVIILFCVALVYKIIMFPLT